VLPVMIQTDPAPIRVLADLGDEQIYHPFLAIERTCTSLQSRRANLPFGARRLVHCFRLSGP
jgi:hypothetical protein